MHRGQATHGARGRPRVGPRQRIAKRRSQRSTNAIVRVAIAGPLQICPAHGSTTEATTPTPDRSLRRPRRASSSQCRRGPRDRDRQLRRLAQPTSLALGQVHAATTVTSEAALQLADSEALMHVLPMGSLHRQTGNAARPSPARYRQRLRLLRPVGAALAAASATRQVRTRRTSVDGAVRTACYRSRVPDTPRGLKPAGRAGKHSAPPSRSGWLPRPRQPRRAVSAKWLSRIHLRTHTCRGPDEACGATDGLRPDRFLP